MKQEEAEIEKEQDVSVNKKRNFYFCVAYSRYFPTSTHKVINRLKSHLTSHGREYKCLTMNLIT